MTRSKAKTPAEPAGVERTSTEVVQRADTLQSEGSGRLSPVDGALHVFSDLTSDEIEACMIRQRQALERTIRDPNTPPIDGGIVRIMGALEALFRVHAGRPNPTAEKAAQ